MEAIELARSGDEIITCGRLFHTGAPVRTWLDADGYDGATPLEAPHAPLSLLLRR